MRIIFKRGGGKKIIFKKKYAMCCIGRKLVNLDKRIDWNTKFLNHLENLDSKKPVILCGDLNVAHLEIDLKEGWRP